MNRDVANFAIFGGGGGDTGFLTNVLQHFAKMSNSARKHFIGTPEIPGGWGMLPEILNFGSPRMAISCDLREIA